VAKKPTIGDLLKEGKKRAQKIRKQSVTKVSKVTDRLPIAGPIGLGVDIADLASQISLALVNQASDMAFQDLQNVPLPRPKTILPNVDQMPQTSQPGGVTVRTRTDKQIVNDQIMRRGMKDANTRARKKNGQLKKGMTQKKIALMAQRYCTKERERLGLCKKPMKRRKRGKNSR
jgi:hypothetical protein